MRHPQEGSRSVGVVHDEELLAALSNAPTFGVAQHAHGKRGHEY